MAAFVCLDLSKGRAPEMTTDARSSVRRFGPPLLVLLLLLGSPVAGLPWIVGLPVVHRSLAAIANSALAPGSVEFSPMRLSWFRPTEIPDVRLRDAEGDLLLDAPKLTFEWGLWQMLVTRPAMARVDVMDAKLDIERRPDGTIDLHETLKPLVPEHPKYRILVHLENSQLRLRDRLLGEPFLADDLDARVDMGRGDEPISWRMSMAPEHAQGQSGRLELEGTYSRAQIDSAGQHDTHVTIKGTAWPFAVANAGRGVKCRGVLDGTIDAQLQSGLWVTKAETKLNRVELSAPEIAETVRVEAVSAGWNVKATESGWHVDQLDLESSLGSLRARGSDYDPHRDCLDLGDLAFEIPYVHVEATGAIRNLTGKPELDLKGTLSPDWGALTNLLAAEIEPDARIAGRPRSWRVSGSIGSLRFDDVLETLAGDLGIEIDELDVFGMRLGHTALVVRAENGKIRLDPIDAALNQGVLHLEPELVRDQNGARWLRLGNSSSLAGAVINDEVTHRVLAYAAPILDGATRVEGRISAKIRDAVFPIAAPARAQARIAADVTFDDVRFMPGLLADRLLGVFDRQDQPLLVLRDSISIEIEDRKVHQKGLVIPVANLASIMLDGSVDFDKNLDLVAGLAMNREARVAGVLPPLLQNARIDIPIRGTLQNPRIDAGRFTDRLGNMGVSFIENAVGSGLNGLQRVLRGKAVKGLGDYLLPRAWPMNPARPSQPEDAAPGSKGLRRPRRPLAEPDAALGGGGTKKDSDDFGE
jgi:hypothetical protein